MFHGFDIILSNTWNLLDPLDLIPWISKESPEFHGLHGLRWLFMKFYKILGIRRFSWDPKKPAIHGIPCFPWKPMDSIEIHGILVLHGYLCIVWIPWEFLETVEPHGFLGLPRSYMEPMNPYRFQWIPWNP